jgi:hypothetical protein
VKDCDAPNHDSEVIYVPSPSWCPAPACSSFSCIFPNCNFKRHVPFSYLSYLTPYHSPASCITVHNSHKAPSHPDMSISPSPLTRPIPQDSNTFPRQYLTPHLNICQHIGSVSSQCIQFITHHGFHHFSFLHQQRYNPKLDHEAKPTAPPTTHHHTYYRHHSVHNNRSKSPPPSPLPQEHQNPLHRSSSRPASLRLGKILSSTAEESIPTPQNEREEDSKCHRLSSARLVDMRL